MPTDDYLIAALEFRTYADDVRRLVRQMRRESDMHRWEIDMYRVNLLRIQTADAKHHTYLSQNSEPPN